MGKLISHDSPIIQALSRIGDLILLNLVYLLTCLPVVTIGAATTSLYAVCFRLLNDRETGLLRTYFHAFRQNFKQATLIWIPALVLFADLILTIWLSLSHSGLSRYFSLLGLFMFVWIVMIFGYIFPLISQFDNKIRLVLRNALILSLGYLPRSLLITILNLIPFIVLLLNPYGFLGAGAIWITLYFATAAYLNTRLLQKVFAPFMPDNPPSEESFLD